MSEKREQFEHGSSKISDFFDWINERHAIWVRRHRGDPKPWTADPVMLDFKFTNVFRELDTGTLELNIMLGEREACPLMIFNCWWYRLFNWYEHAQNLGFVEHYDQLHEYMMKLHKSDGRIFTAAHMVRGVGGERKVFPYLRLSKLVFDDREQLYTRIAGGTLQNAFNVLMSYYLMGDFTSYEVVCDLRWHVLENAPDILTWGNPGNGARRGLKRLGLKPTVESMVHLWKIAPQYLAPWVLPHHSLAKTDGVPQQWPYFEVREIEHSLCEFDKYVRTQTGLSRPRQRYNGRS